jgi:hypothetical protein
MGKASKALLAVAVLAASCGAGVLIGSAVAGSGTPGGAQQLADGPATAAAPAPKAAGITDGTWRVGDEVKAGTYTATVPDGELCSWERLRGFTGGDDLIDIGVGNGGERMRVTIKKTDAGFKTQGCGPWKAAK